MVKSSCTPKKTRLRGSAEKKKNGQNSITYGAKGDTTSFLIAEGKGLRENATRPTTQQGHD